jgi:hypothetical protein
MTRRRYVPPAARAAEEAEIDSHSLTKPLSGGRPQMATAPIRKKESVLRIDFATRPAGRSDACRKRGQPLRRRKRAAT